MNERQAFVDDSLEKDQVLVLAGYLATEEKWAAFTKDWRAEAAKGTAVIDAANF